MNNLLVWQKSHELVLDIYEATKHFPKYELFGLVSQMRRSAVSVPCNIVEGRARGSNKDFKRFLVIAKGSLEELKYQILLSKELNYINKEDFNYLNNKVMEIGRLLPGLIKRVENEIGVETF